MKAQQARKALQAILAICDGLERDAPPKGAEGLLKESVRDLDEYLTGSTRSRNYDDTPAKETIEYGSRWEVYLSDGGYTRMVIDPCEEQRVWLTYGSDQTHRGFAEKVRRFKALKEV